MPPIWWFLCCQCAILTRSHLNTPPDAELQTESRLSDWFKRFGLFLFLVVGLVLVLALDLTRFLTYDSLQRNHAFLQHWVGAHPWGAMAIYVGVYIVVISLSLPGGAFMTTVGGYLFGIVAGTLLAAGSATIGAVIVFIAARKASRNFIQRRTGRILRRIEAGFKRDMLSYMIFLRVVPVFPFLAINLALAFLGAPLKLYTLTTFFGIIPGSAIYAGVGNGLGELLDAGKTPSAGMLLEPAIYVPILLLALLSLLPIGYRLWRGRRAKRKKQETQNHAT